MTSSIRKAFMVAAAIFAAVSLQAADAKYVFYFIGDGMGLAQAINAQLYNKHVLGNSEPLLMTTFPTVSMITTHSASSDVTDSAAAGTALACGTKTNNGMMGVLPDSTSVTSVAKTLFDNGYGVAIVTSVAIDDATPGAFYTHVPDRGMFYEIGRTLGESGYQFFAGAGLRGTRDRNGNDNGLVDYIRSNGYNVAYGMEEIDPEASQVLLLSPYTDRPSNIGFAIDSVKGALTLPEMTRTAIGHMTRTSPDRFFMMVEGGSIDHGGHSNDGGTILREVVNFNQALQHAYDFYTAHPDETLIVVTADHETGGMSVGCKATGYSTQLQRNAGQRISKDGFNEYCAKLKADTVNNPTWDDMEAFMAEKLGYGTSFKPGEAEQAKIKALFNDVFVARSDNSERRTLYGSFNAFTDAVFNQLNSISGMGWTSGSHTGIPVPVYAIGVGAELFGGFPDNTELPGLILKAAGK